MPVFALAYLHDALRREGRDAARAVEPSCGAGSRNAILPEGGSAHVEELSDPYLLWFWNSNVRSTAIVLNSLVRGGRADAPCRADGALAAAGAQERPLGQHAGERAARSRRSSPTTGSTKSTSPDFTRGRDARRRRARARRSSRAARPRRRRRDVPMRDVLAAGAGRHRRSRSRSRARAPARSSTPRGCATPSIGCSRTGSTRAFASSAATRRTSRTARGRAATTFKAGDLVRVTLTLRPDEGAPLRRRHRSAARRLRAGRVVVRDDRRVARARAGRPGRGAGDDWIALVAARRLRSRRAPRRRVQLFATRLSEGRHEFTLHRPRDDRRARSARRRRTRRRCTSRRCSAARRRRVDRGATVMSDVHRARVGLEAAAANACGMRPRSLAIGAAALRAVARVSGRLPAGLLDERRRRRRRSSSIATACRCTRRCRATARAACRSTPARCRRCSSAATLAAEDRRFWSHPGVDPDRDRARGRGSNLRRGQRRRGRLDDHAAGRQAAAAAPRRPHAPRGVRAKIHEAVLALRLEHRFTKREILALYLNLAPYGNQIAAPSAPASVYFGVDAVDADAGAGGVSRRAAAAAVGVQSVAQSRRRRRAAADGAAAHGGGRRADRRARPREARAERLTLRRAARRRSSRRTSSRWCWPRAGDSRPRADRDDARRRAAARGRRHHRSHERARCSARRRATSRSSCSTTRAASGWRGKDRATTSTPEHGGAINGAARAAAARLGAEAVHLRAGVRAGLHARRRVLPDVPSHFPTAEAGRPLQPAQLRRPVPRSAARAARAGRIGERAGRRARVRGRRPHAAAVPRARGPVARSTRRRRTTASA